MELWRGRRLWIERRTVDLPSGPKEYVVVHPGGAVAVLPVDGDEVVLIRQYRAAVGGWVLEAPAGTLEPGEEPAACAARELIEEARVAAEELVPLGTILTTPGFSDEVIHLFLGRGITPCTAYPPDEDEQIEVERIPVGEVRAMALDGRIADAKTLCLVLRALVAPAPGP
ncbi:MAG TPA: NUDIX hydrolase [Methanoregulaceae archaeon]|nr:NUDIX hydrolase [Methanoregulaceae archaeon]